MARKVVGGCACGSIRYQLLDKPMFVHCCHCDDCQRLTGSAFGTQRDHRDSGNQNAPRQAGSRGGAARERSARNLPLPQVSDRGLERLRTEGQCPVRARWNARQPRRPEAGRAHLYPVESEVAQAAEANAVVPGLLQHQEAVA